MTHEEQIAADKLERLKAAACARHAIAAAEHLAALYKRGALADFPAAKAAAETYAEAAERLYGKRG